MKKKFFTRFFGAAMLLSFAACAEQEDIIPVDNTKGADVSFALDIQDFTTRVDVDEACPDMDELETMALENRLFTRFTIENSIYPLDGTNDKNTNEIGEKTFVREINFTTEGIVADPVAISADSESSLIDFVVFEKDGDKENILYSAYSVESELASKFLDEEELLPMGISIPEGEKFQKVLCDIVVSCATESSPQDFGFKMWDINFVKRFNIPYVVNNCYYDGLHFVATGYIEVYNASMVDGQLVAGKEKLYTSVFDGTKPADLWLYDNYSEEDENEWLYIKLFLNPVERANNEMREGWINIANAKQIKYIDSNYIEEFETLDIDLCSDEPSLVGSKEIGTYWIEDLWGLNRDRDVDFDYNDLIVEYTYYKYYTHSKDPQGQPQSVLHKMDMSFKFIARGAGNINAFAMRLNGVKGSDLNPKAAAYSIYKKDGGAPSDDFHLVTGQVTNKWGMTDGQLYTTDKDVLVIPIEGELWSCFEGQTASDAKKITNSYITEKKGDYKKGSVINVKVTFNTTSPQKIDVSPMLLWAAPSTQYFEGHEINIPGVEPSCKLAQTFYDKSYTNIVGDKYIVEVKGRNLPWIIDIPEHNVKYPAERMPITDYIDRFNREQNSKYDLGQWGIGNTDFRFNSEVDKWYKQSNNSQYPWYPVVP